MNYHDITHCDMLNGSGIRVTLWVAGCNHTCKNCQNPITWDPCGGIAFNEAAYNELIEAIGHPYISGLTLSGGDPMFPDNREEVLKICKKVKGLYPTKNIWMYTGYKLEEISKSPILEYVDVLVDGMYIEQLRSVDAHWVGSTNQRIINLKKTIAQNEIVLYEA